VEQRERALEALELRQLFGSCYQDRRVLVTGHTGFKGSWLCLWLSEMGAQVAGLALDPDTDPAHWRLLDLELALDARVDLRAAGEVGEVFARFRPEMVFHLAAQALVRRSYREPVATFDTNIMGLVNLLEAVRATPEVRVVVNATTDKVYEPRTTSSAYREDDPLGGHDPYSTSKACSELISACYAKSYFQHGDLPPVRWATARAGNVIGGGDWAEDRLIPDLVRSLHDRAARVRNPNATRPWQHVLEPLAGYLRLGQVLLADESAQGAWNFGPALEDTLSVAEVVAALEHEWPELHVQADRGPHPHEAAHLALDSSKAQSRLGWTPVWNSRRALTQTAAWYRDFLQHGQVGSRGDLATYVQDARDAELGWAR
jgi:CDP-glucose 4,6-dehydratase